MRELLYRPREAWAADFIPFYEGGRFHLFYPLDWRNRPKYGEGTPWYRITTADFLQFTEHGEALPRGSPEEQDLYVFTGSVIRAGGQYHLFYTGHNPHFRRHGKPEQAVMHAVSGDLRVWRKLQEHTFFAPEAEYEPHDWRDPLVLRSQVKENEALSSRKLASAGRGDTTAVWPRPANPLPLARGRGARAARCAILAPFSATAPSARSRRRSPDRSNST